MSYGAGALIAIVASTGALLVLSGAGLLRVDPFTAVGVVVAVFGVYTVAYGAASRDPLYYLLWGGVALAAGLGIAASTLLNPIVVLGLALVFVAALGAAATLLRRRR
ncbi:MAG: hypothetical protein NZ953_01005 [Thaumarchaeota archaeon]|nr:hypothetical protein [Candidatus Calditenuaceae archaeon]MDW8043082.1 hypothetical protein [Nitrososphaerota archaeon]